MIFVRDYLFNSYLIPYYLIGAVVYIVVRVVFMKCKKIHFVLQKELINLVFASYIIILISATVLPRWYEQTIDGETHIKFMLNEPKFNFIPFRTIYSFFMTSGENALINLGANISLLFPFGLLFPVICSRYRRRTILCGMLFSLAIEILQIIPGRSTDIDDLILNTAGCAAGYGIYYVFRRIHCSGAASLEQTD